MQFQTQESDPEFFKLRSIDTQKRKCHELPPLDSPNDQGLQTGEFLPVVMYIHEKLVY